MAEFHTVAVGQIWESRSDPERTMEVLEVHRANNLLRLKASARSAPHVENLYLAEKALNEHWLLRNWIPKLKEAVISNLRKVECPYCHCKHEKNYNSGFTVECINVNCQFYTPKLLEIDV